jgi:hypothetical protein
MQSEFQDSPTRFFHMGNHPPYNPKVLAMRAEQDENSMYLFEISQHTRHHSRYPLRCEKDEESPFRSKSVLQLLRKLDTARCTENDGVVPRWNTQYMILRFQLCELDRRIQNSTILLRVAPRDTDEQGTISIGKEATTRFCLTCRACATPVQKTSFCTSVAPSKANRSNFSAQAERVI